MPEEKEKVEVMVPTGLVYSIQIVIRGIPYTNWYIIYQSSRSHHFDLFFASDMVLFKNKKKKIHAGGLQASSVNSDPSLCCLTISHFC